MALFNFLKNKKRPKEAKQNEILLAMPMFNDGKNYELNKVIANLKTFWNLDITNIEGDDQICTFNINGVTVAFAAMPFPIPEDDIKGTAHYAYNWPTALQDLEKHTGHTIVSVMQSEHTAIERFRILSKVLGSILATSEAIGVYQGSQSLLIPRAQYLNDIEELKEDGVAIMLWIYIGLRTSAAGNSAYTFGLKDFGKTEMEIVESNLSMEELFNFLFNITSYVIGNDITLKDGETVGATTEQKILIKTSKGKFIDGESLKLMI